MGNFAHGIYKPRNPQKYIGKGSIKYRSSWELVFCQFCDNNNKILKWASESIQIPYKNPLTGKQTIYIPDFFIVYQDKNGKILSEVIEIKPKKQTILEEKVTSARDRAALVVNHAKWNACSAWCKKMGLTFRVINEEQIFHNGRK